MIEAESDASDGEHLLNTTEPPADSATEGEASVECARLEHDALLSEQRKRTLVQI